MQLGEALAQSLDERVTVNTAGDPNRNRKTGGKRRYVTNRKRKKAPSPKVQELVPLRKIVDGSAFKKPRRDSSESDLSRALDRTENREEGGATCCGSRCHEKWGRDTFAKVRAVMPPRGLGQQKARNIFVRSCFTENEARLHIRSGTDATQVCWVFFRVLKGASFSLIKSASSNGGTVM